MKSLRLLSFQKLKYNSILMALVIFVLTASVFCRLVFRNIENWGMGDWDQHLFWHAVPRDTILHYHQFPLWNPYTCGGNVMFANPQSRFPSPFFLLHLVLGTIIALKIEIWLHIIIGMFGTFMLARYLNLGEVSSYLPAFLFMFNSYYALHLTVGHTWLMAVAYLPYVILFYLMSIDRLKHLKYTILCGLFLSLMLYEGGSYHFPYTVLFLSLMTLLLYVQRDSLKPLWGYAVVLVFCFLFSALI